MRFLVLFVFTIFAAVVSALPVPSSPYGGDYRSNMLSVINNDREAHNLSPATLSNCLNAVAAQHSQQLLKNSGAPEFLTKQSLNEDTDLSCKHSLGEIVLVDLQLNTNELGTMQSWIESAQVGFGMDENVAGDRYWTVAFTN
ncbi:hypothetical protein BDF19DRAFT_435491 [Syncephalis fuscata]|nr:hypothetical protein BDF19DRAFT_435491 [Syncephalis fuscata]